MLFSDKAQSIEILQYGLNYIPYSIILAGIYAACHAIPYFDVLLLGLPPLWFLYAFIGINVFFILYLLVVLIQVKRYGWLTALLLLILFPGLVLFVLKVNNSMQGILTTGVTLLLAMIILLFYIGYYYLLKMAVTEWPDE